MTTNSKPTTHSNSISVEDNESELDRILSFYYITLDNGNTYSPSYYEVNKESWEEQKRALLSWRNKAIEKAIEEAYGDWHGNTGL